MDTHTFIHTTCINIRNRTYTYGHTHTQINQANSRCYVILMALVLYVITHT